MCLFSYFSVKHNFNINSDNLEAEYFINNIYIHETWLHQMHHKNHCFFHHDMYQFMTALFT